MKCKSCGAKVIKFPMWEGQEQGDPFSWNRIKWLNLFKMDFMSIVFIVFIIVLAISYKMDISKCEEMITDPLTYCKESNACKVIEEMKEANPYGTVDINNIPKFNAS